MLQAALLGVVQGLTEFLPVSSSAHLILARACFGWDTERFGLAFDVACHVGTLAALMVYFRREVAGLVAAVPSAFSTPRSDAARLLWLIVVGTIPIVLVVMAFGDLVEGALRTPRVAITALAVGAIVLVMAERFGSRRREEGSLSGPEAFLLGGAQALALVPGVSRSGSTISAGMLLGLRRDSAARFGFLLGIPAVAAAAAKAALDLAATGLSRDAAQLMLIGAVTSGVVGYLTVKYFLRFLAGHSLTGFAWYRLAVAGLAFWWLAR